MAYLSTSTASADIADWVEIDATWADDEDSKQIAQFNVSFSDNAATATVGVALVGQDNTVYVYYTGLAKALSRRSDADDGGGNYIGAIDFVSGAAPSSYSHVASNKIDLMHGDYEAYGASSNGPLRWVFGLPTISAGTVSVFQTATKVV